MKNQIQTISTTPKILQKTKIKRIRTKDHEQRKEIKALRKVLKANEWSGDSTKKTCPECRAKKKDGHLVDCEWQKVLEETDKESL